MERDVPNYQDKPHEPANPQNWYKCYKKLVRESRKEIDKDAALLKATIEGINNEKAKHKLKRVDLDFVKLPEGVKRDAQIIHLPNKIRFIDRGAQHGPVPSQKQMKINRGEVDYNAPPRIIEPKGKLDQFKKEAKAMGHFQHQKLKRPTGIITARETALRQKLTATTIVNAPRALIEEHRAASVPKPIDPTTRATAVVTPNKRRIEHNVDERPESSIIEEREKRLTAFTNPSSALKAVPTIIPPRSRTSTPAASSPAQTPPSVAPKPPVAAGSAFGQIGKRNIEVLTNQKIQDVGNRQHRIDEERKYELRRLGPKEWDSQPSVRKAAPATPQPKIAPNTFSSSKVRAREITAPEDRVPETSASSPSNKGATPPMMRKKKRAVDVFMPPNKKPRRS